MGASHAFSIEQKIALFDGKRQPFGQSADISLEARQIDGQVPWLQKSLNSGNGPGNTSQGLNDHRLKGGGLTLRLKVACLRLKPPDRRPAESRLKAR
jgi:hypothetical protein